jgi:predicted Zn finger-like uncharacterized protein
MQIICPSCATSYHIDASSLGAAGRSVRCVRCRNVWFAGNPGAFAAIAQAHRDSIADMIRVRSDVTLAAMAEPPDTPGASTPSPEITSPAPVLERAAEVEPEAEPALGESPIPLREPFQWLDEQDGQAPAGVALDNEPASLPAGPSVQHIETFARRALPRPRQRRWRTSALALAMLGLAALDAALIGGRAQVVKALPQTASLYGVIGLPVNLRGLSFSDVATSIETRGGVPVLVIGGTAFNATARSVEVPRLRFSAHDAGGQEIHAWTALTESNVLLPGASLAFQSQLASPPPETRAVMVRFFNRRDLAVSR